LPLYLSFGQKKSLPLIKYYMRKGFLVFAFRSYRPRHKKSLASGSAPFTKSEVAGLRRACIPPPTRDKRVSVWKVSY